MTADTRQRRARAARSSEWSGFALSFPVVITWILFMYYLASHQSYRLTDFVGFWPQFLLVGAGFALVHELVVRSSSTSALASCARMLTLIAAVGHVAFSAHFLTLSTDQIRQEVRIFDHQLGQEVLDHDYAGQCHIATVQDLFHTVMDVYIAIHFFGWFLAGFVFRSFSFSFFLGCWDEIIELTFEHIFENFRECWYDHILADILIANTAGAYAGAWVSRWVGFRAVEWRSTGGRLSARRLAVLGAAFMYRLGVFLMPFAFKYLMWVPVVHVIFFMHAASYFAVQGYAYHTLHAIAARDASAPCGWLVFGGVQLFLDAAIIARGLLDTRSWKQIVPPQHVFVMWGAMLCMWGIAMLRARSYPSTPRKKTQ